ncbi:hypothetical protein DW086_08655 [Harryflintia acetispora]|nr:hypothetical protein DW086_08655 [Harryflintia acetispora]
MKARLKKPPAVWPGADCYSLQLKCRETLRHRRGHALPERWVTDKAWEAPIGKLRNQAAFLLSL